MKVQDCIPQDKHDVAAIRHAEAIGFSRVEPILGALLEWVQDVNWPVARHTATFLRGAGPEIAPHVLEVLRGSDADWKANVLREVASHLRPDAWSAIADEVERIASTPTSSEAAEEVDKASRAALAYRSRADVTGWATCANRDFCSIDAAVLGLSFALMTTVAIILAPFHGGVRSDRVGQGPLRLMELGLVDRLAADGADVSIRDLGEIGECEGEVGRSFEVKRQVAQAVAEAIGAGRFPIVLAGNCNASVGTFAGLGSPEAELVWFDAHTDFDTPDERTSGYFDGMGVGTLTGRCWHALAATVPGFRPLAFERLVYCGVRDFDPGQWEPVAARGIRAVRGGADRPASFAEALNRELRDDAGPALIHLDMDCLDTAEGHANAYASPGGLSGAELLACLDQVTGRARPLALTVASYDPGQPGADRIGEIAIEAVGCVARTAPRL